MLLHDFMCMQRPVAMLRTAIKGRSMPNALIISGVEGSGKSSLARVVARALLCSHPRDGEPCGECSSCRRAISGNHPDIKILAPEGATFKVEDLDELPGDILLRPYEGEYKIYILEDAHTMNASVQNKLLKTLEEPPEYAIIMLLCRSTAPLLPTVLSRCMHIRLPAVPREALQQMLVAQGAQEEQAAYIAAAASGSVGRARALFGDEEFARQRDEALQGLKSFFEPGGPLKAMEQLSSSRDELTSQVLLWQSYMRDMLVLAAGGKNILNRDKQAELSALASLYDERIYSDMLEALLQAETRLKENASVAITRDGLMVGMEKCICKK